MAFGLIIQDMPQPLGFLAVVQQPRQFSRVNNYFRPAALPGADIRPFGRADQVRG